MKRIIKISVIVLAAIIGLWLTLVLVSKLTATHHDAKPFVKNLQKFTIAGHRGASVDFPPNTLEAFRRLKQIDPRAMLELDVWETKDGAVVVFHDDILDLSTRGKGPISSHTLAEIRSLEAGYNISFDGGKSYPFRGKGYRIPTLEQVLKEFPASIISIDIKYPMNSFAEKVLAMVLAHGMLDRVVIGSFSDDMVKFIRARYPSVTLSFSSSDAKLFLVLNWLCLTGFFRSDCDILMVPQFSNTDRPEYLGKGVSQGFRVLTRKFIDSARRLGFPVFAWTINKRENMEELIDIGIDGIITDVPGILKEIIDRRKETVEKKLK